MGLSECVGVVSGVTASGSASFNGYWSDWRLSANLADDVARDLVEVMDKRRLDTALVTMDGLGETQSDARLGWAEVTPLWFLAEARGTSGTRKRVLPQVKTFLAIDVLILYELCFAGFAYPQLSPTSSR